MKICIILKLLLNNFQNDGFSLHVKLHQSAFLKHDVFRRVLRFLYRGINFLENVEKLENYLLKFKIKMMSGRKEIVAAVL